MITSGLLLVFCLLVLRFSKNLTQETDGVVITIYNEGILPYNKAFRSFPLYDLLSLDYSLVSTEVSTDFPVPENVIISFSMTHFCE